MLVDNLTVLIGCTASSYENDTFNSDHLLGYILSKMSRQLSIVVTYLHEMMLDVDSCLLYATSIIHLIVALS